MGLGVRLSWVWTLLLGRCWTSEPQFPLLSKGNSNSTYSVKLLGGWTELMITYQYLARAWQAFIHLHGYWWRACHGPGPRLGISFISTIKDKHPCPSGDFRKGGTDNKHNKWVSYSTLERKAEGKTEQRDGAGEWAPFKIWWLEEALLRRWHLSRDVKEEEIHHEGSEGHAFLPPSTVWAEPKACSY